MIKALIVDDEMPARNELIFMLEETGKAEVIGEAGDVPSAISLIKAHNADVLFLDINMPGYSGLQLAEVLKTHPNPPAIVFVTAYSNFALKAFDVNAIDYLVKPVESERLLATLEKVEKTMGTKTQTAPLEHGAGVTRVTVNKGGKKHFLSSADITYIRARDDYSYLYTDEAKFLSTTSLTNLLEQLEGYGFYRTHRGFVVNLNRIQSVESQTGGTLKLTLNDPEHTEIPVSRRRVAQLKQEMNI